MRKSIFMLIILIVFGIFLFSISLAAKGSIIGLLLILIWGVGVTVGMRIFSHPRFAKYHSWKK